MDPALLAMLMEYILSRQTEGDASIGGDLPYDDYGIQGTIGGLGATDPNAYPFEDWDDIGPGNSWGNTGNIGRDATGGVAPPQPIVPGAGADSTRGERLGALLMAMQQGADNGVGRPMQGLFGGGPVVERSPGPPIAMMGNQGMTTIMTPNTGGNAGQFPPSLLPSALDDKEKQRVAAPRTLPPQASPQAQASTGRNLRPAAPAPAASAVVRAIQMARQAASAPAPRSNPPPAPTRSFGAPAARVQNTSTRKLR